MAIFVPATARSFSFASASAVSIPHLSLIVYIAIARRTCAAEIAPSRRESAPSSHADYCIWLADRIRIIELSWYSPMIQ